MLDKFYLLRHEYKIKRLIKTDLQVGKKTLLFNNVKDYGFEPGLVTIGDGCVIAAGVLFITNPVVGKLCCDQEQPGGNRITIRDNCFIGVDAIIYPNVVIGPNAIIGAGAVIMSDVPPDMCVMGNPSRVSCTLDFYASTCKRGMVPNYVPAKKRMLLQEYFWNAQRDLSDKVGSRNT